MHDYQRFRFFSEFVVVGTQDSNEMKLNDFKLDSDRMMAQNLFMFPGET